MILARVLTVIILTIFVIVGVTSIVYISTNASPLRFAVYNNIKCKDSTSCITPLNNQFEIPSQIDTSDINTKLAAISCDLIGRVEARVYNTEYGLEAISKISNSFNDKKIFTVIWKYENSLFISFRGTWAIQEWINNFNISQVSKYDITDEFRDIPVCMENNNKVMIHKGFVKLYSEIKYSFIKQIENNADKNTPIIISGHSLGAAIATILGLDLKLLGYNCCVYSFSSPRIGNKEFSKTVTDSKLPVFRINNTEDTIPDTPTSVSPNFTNHDMPYFYYHTGTLYTFSDNWFSIFNNHSLACIIENLNNLKS